MLNNQTKSYLVILPIILIWGSFAAVSKLALRNLDSFQLQFYIFLIAALVYLSTIIFLKKLNLFKKLTLKSFGWLVICAITVFFYYFCYWLSLELIPASEAMLLNYVFPIMIVIFAIPIHKEKLTIRKVITIILGFIGVLIIATKGDILNFRLSNILGDSLALLAGCFWGLFTNLGKKVKEDVNIRYFIYFAVMFLLSIPILFIFSKPILPPLSSLWGILSLGTLNFSLCFFLWFKALELGRTIGVASLSYLTPFVSLTYISLLLKERIVFAQILGLLLIMGGALIQHGETTE
jgi:drug/metabolite transporter (DMT)-like permease